MNYRFGGLGTGTDPVAPKRGGALATWCAGTRTRIEGKAALEQAEELRWIAGGVEVRDTQISDYSRVENSTHRG